MRDQTQTSDSNSLNFRVDRLANGFLVYPPGGGPAAMAMKPNAVGEQIKAALVGLYPETKPKPRVKPVATTA